MTIEDWNTCEQVQKNDEINSTAIEGDIVELIDGYLFLIQRQNDMNNIIFTAIAPESPLCVVFHKLKELLIDNGIQFVRVEGNLHRYRYLGRMVDAEQLQDTSEKSRNVFYLKLF